MASESREIPALASGETAGAFDSPWVRRVFVFVVALFAITGAVDLYLDGADQRDALHIIVEGVALLLALYLLGRWGRDAMRRLRHAADELSGLRAAGEVARAEFRAAHEDAIAHMRAAIEAQYARWGLSAAERQLAWALLRGYSLEQIAARRGRSPHTIRNQTTALYAKSGMSGRHDLAAFFLADLLGEDDSDSDDIS